MWGALFPGWFQMKLGVRVVILVSWNRRSNRNLRSTFISAARGPVLPAEMKSQLLQTCWFLPFLLHQIAFSQLFSKKDFVASGFQLFFRLQTARKSVAMSWKRGKTKAAGIVVTHNSWCLVLLAHGLTQTTNRRRVMRLWRILQLKVWEKIKRHRNYFAWVYCETSEMAYTVSPWCQIAPFWKRHLFLWAGPVQPAGFLLVPV